jgi:2-dehydro-3-deoxygluconokinase
MPEHTTEIVTLGEAMRLLVAEPGVALRRAATFRASVAGAETNVAVGLARQGFVVRWLGRVGANAAGAAVLAELRADGIDVGAVEVDAERHTGLLMRDSHPIRPIEVQYYRAGAAVAALSADYVRHHGLGGAWLVHITGITAMLSGSARGAVHALVDLARADGVAVSFDPNVRRKLGSPEQWRSVLRPLLGKADLIFAGTDELELVMGGSAVDATTMLLDGGARCAAQTRGQVREPDHR